MTTIRVAGFALLVAVAALAQDTPAPAQVTQLDWMAGCWEGQMGKARVEEQWMKPAGGSMLGMARTIVDGKTVMTESHQIAGHDAELVLTVILRFSGKPTAFKMIRLTADEVVFENPQHDFPQRILYRKQPGGLLGRIEGEQQGKPKAQNFPMKRARCDSSSL